MHLIGPFSNNDRILCEEHQRHQKSFPSNNTSSLLAQNFRNWGKDRFDFNCGRGITVESVPQLTSD